MSAKAPVQVAAPTRMPAGGVARLQHNCSRSGQTSIAGDSEEKRLIMQRWSLPSEVGLDGGVRHLR